jgi:RNA polymerase sigma-70 factor, ECF subfamily
MTPEVLESERSYLTGLAYRLLGSRADAEDVVQEALTRGAAIDDARTPRALLTTIVTRLCLDELRSARRRREAYVGPWLPEPVLSGVPADADRLERTESVSYGFLLLLETLSPPERAVFVLREVFELDFAEIAEALGKTEAACRQLLHRAREHMAAKRRRFPRPDQQAALASRFLGALASGDVSAMVALLVDEAEAVSDHGGKASASRNVVHGADRVAKLLVGLARKGAAGTRSLPAWVNGNPALLVYVGDTLISAIVLDTVLDGDEARIAGFHIVRNPDKLAALAELR